VPEIFKRKTSKTLGFQLAEINGQKLMVQIAINTLQSACFLTHGRLLGFIQLD
jgi:hypothetical protein